jgi:hypothetical protein
MIGVEPTCLAAPDPKSGASANFATSALWGAKVGVLINTKSRNFKKCVMIAKNIFLRNKIVYLKGGFLVNFEKSF